MDRYRQAAAEELGVDSSGLLALIHLVERELTPTELASALGLTSASVTALVDRLSDAGLVERHPHPEDRRSLLVALTPDGRKSVGAIAQELIDAADRALSAVGVRHHSAVVRFLRAAVDDAAGSESAE